MRYVNKPLVVGLPRYGKRRYLGLYKLRGETALVRTAILVDGGYYRKRATFLWDRKSPNKRADELYAYCMAHINDEKRTEYARSLYRLFYYDCPPLEKTVFHPKTMKGIDFRRSDTYRWTLEFFEELKKQRKVALRLGELSDERATFRLSDEATKRLFAKKISIDDISEKDFDVSFSQKGVDMRIGLDIASLSYKKQVEQIILIAGDSDFVPAAKLARREGVDFVLDPMWARVRPDLFEHIDGLKSLWGKDSQKPR